MCKILTCFHVFMWLALSVFSQDEYRKPVKLITCDSIILDTSFQYRTEGENRTTKKDLYIYEDSDFYWCIGGGQEIGDKELNLMLSVPNDSTKYYLRFKENGFYLLVIQSLTVEGLRG